jgi:hypothetical protein
MGAVRKAVNWARGRQLSQKARKKLQEADGNSKDAGIGPLKKWRGRGTLVWTDPKRLEYGRYTLKSRGRTADKTKEFRKDGSIISMDIEPRGLGKRRTIRYDLKGRKTKK